MSELRVKYKDNGWWDGWERDVYEEEWGGVVVSELDVGARESGIEAGFSEDHWEFW